MRRRDFINLLGGATVLWPLAARAQQPERVRRLGVLMGYSEGDKQGQAGANALRTGLQNLGWIEGRNIQIDYRWPGPDAEKARSFAKELIGMSPDVIVSSTNQVTAILQQETRTIPIVFAFVGGGIPAGHRSQPELRRRSRLSRLYARFGGPNGRSNYAFGASHPHESAGSAKCDIQYGPRGRALPRGSIYRSDSLRPQGRATARRNNRGPSHLHREPCAGRSNRRRPYSVAAPKGTYAQHLHCVV